MPWSKGGGAATSALYTSYSSFNFVGGTTYQDVVQRIYLDLSRSNIIFGTSDTVQPPALTVRHYIKF